MSAANLVCSLVFMGVHFLRHPPPWAARVFFPSPEFGWLRERHRGVAASRGLHVLFNLERFAAAAYAVGWPPVAVTSCATQCHRMLPVVLYLRASPYADLWLNLRQCGPRERSVREHGMGASNSAVRMAIPSGLLRSSSGVLAQNSAVAGVQSQSRIGSGARLQKKDRRVRGEMDRQPERLYARYLRREPDRERIYGGNLMTAAERSQYEERLRSLATERERVHFRMVHQQQIRRRAEARHEWLGRAPSKAQLSAEEHARQHEREQIYGYSMMTPQEVARYQARMGVARSEQEREHVRSEHRRQMENRAREPGAPPPQ